MPKSTVRYVCSECGESFPTWSGRCPNCGQWNTLTQFREAKLGGDRPGRSSQIVEAAEFQPLGQEELNEAARLQTFSAELNTVLGGGIVPGSAIVLGGDPGIGKSTLGLQLVKALPNSLYVSGEESLAQVQLRSRRLGLLPLEARFSTATNVLEIIAGLQENEPTLVIIDSIQTLYHPDYPSTPGSVVQIRESALSLVQFCKRANISVILIGHVTKEGTIAGPRLLEHLVDVVLYVEGDRYGQARLLRSVKNRFGPAGEVGVFEMTEQGLLDVSDPSRIFLPDQVEPSPGQMIACVLEGNRPFLVEVQALVTKTSFPSPRRTVSGYDLNRLHVLLAVLEERAGLKLSMRDVYVNIVGGMAVKDRGADLALCLAITSAAKDVALPIKLACFGEVGLTGEIRPVALADRRRREIEKSGLNHIPDQKNLKQLLAQVLNSV